MKWLNITVDNKLILGKSCFHSLVLDLDIGRSEGDGVIYWSNYV